MTTMRFSDLKFTKNKISHWGSIGVGLNWGRGSIGPGAQLGRGSIGLGLNWGGAQLGWGSIGVGLNWAGAQLGQGLNWAWGSTEPEPTTPGSNPGWGKELIIYKKVNFSFLV